jgi:hypothetical protein
MFSDEFMRAAIDEAELGLREGCIPSDPSSFTVGGSSAAVTTGESSAAASYFMARPQPLAAPRSRGHPFQRGCVRRRQRIGGLLS